jgi:hypothetical protein
MKCLYSKRKRENRDIEFPIESLFEGSDQTFMGVLEIKFDIEIEGLYD